MPESDHQMLISATRRQNAMTSASVRAAVWISKYERSEREERHPCRTDSFSHDQATPLTTCVRTRVCAISYEAQVGGAEVPACHIDAMEGGRVEVLRHWHVLALLTHAYRSFSIPPHT
jgi:hypothetical protein